MPRTKQLYNLEDKIPAGVSRDKTLKHQIHRSFYTQPDKKRNRSFTALRRTVRVPEK